MNNSTNNFAAGIGTYVKGQSSSSRRINFWPKIKSAVLTTIDQAIGASFRDHVLAGYRFIMRYYAPGDHIYIFGFSRGAYTARFLAEMLHGIGLLSKGNEEMIHFAWETFGNYQDSRANDPQTDKDRELELHMEKFKKTFCRPDVEVHFLGLFDCVNSVGSFEIPFFRTSWRYIAAPAARYIRHAVSIHERRLKFKPALFHFGKDAPPVDFKEVWFAGNHSDVGGGYRLERGQKHLLSDTPLNWMIQEVLNLEGSESKLSFATTNVAEVAKAENAFPGKETPGTNGWLVRRRANQPHDTLKFGHGSSFLMVIFWWIIGKLKPIPQFWIIVNRTSTTELLPIFTRLELEHGKWVPRRLPPNLGAPRDIPRRAEFHPSVNEMVKAGIIEKSSIPEKGGDNPILPSASSVVNTWGRVRKNLANQASTISNGTSGEANGSAHETEKNGIHHAKTWG